MARKPAPRPELDEEEAPPPPSPPHPVTVLMSAAAPQRAGGPACPLFPAIPPGAGIDRVKVTRLDPPDGYLGTLPVTADEEMVRQTYGGRVYEIIAITAGGKMVPSGRRTITINAPARMPGDAAAPPPAQGGDAVTMKFITEMMRDRELSLREQMEWKEKEAEAAIKRREAELEAALKRREHEAEIALRREREQADMRRREDEARAERVLAAERQRATDQAQRDREFYAQQAAQSQANNALILQVMQTNKSGGLAEFIPVLSALKDMMGSPEVDPQLAMMGQVGQMLGSVATMATAPQGGPPPQLGAPAGRPAPKGLPPGAPRPMRPAPPLPTAAKPPAPAPPSGLPPGLSPETVAKLMELNDLIVSSGATFDQIADGILDGQLKIVATGPEDGFDDEEEEPEGASTLENPPREAQGPAGAQDRAHAVAHPRPGDGGRPDPGAVAGGPGGNGGPAPSS